MTRCFAAAHRGLSSEVTENTLAAFQAAAKAGFPSIELDVRVTRDHEVVVVHDAGIEGTTGGNGKVADMRYDELRGYQTAHGPIPRLDDVFAAMRDWTGIWNLEVKALAAAEPLAHLVEHHGLVDRCLISSFDPAALAVARQAAPAIARGLIVGGPVDHDDLRAVHELDCRWINVEAAALDAPLVKRITDHGLHVGAWTVNDPVRAKELARHGVSCVITDLRAVGDALGKQAGFV